MDIKETITLFLEKNVPTDPSKWQYYVSQAKKKFDVYPSAYANGWAAKQYKDAGGKWKTEEGEEPQHVAQGLPQTKELKGKLIGEKLMQYFQEIGLKHAAYQNENGEIKVIGLNKNQIKEAIDKIVKEWVGKKMNEAGFPGGVGVGLTLPGGYINGAPSEDDREEMKDKLGRDESVEGDRIQNLNNRIKALKQKLSATKSSEQKKLFQDRIKNALQTLSNYKKGYGIKAPHTESVNEAPYNHNNANVKDHPTIVPKNYLAKLPKGDLDGYIVKNGSNFMVAIIDRKHKLQISGGSVNSFKNAVIFLKKKGFDLQPLIDMGMMKPKMESVNEVEIPNGFQIIKVLNDIVKTHSAEKVKDQKTGKVIMVDVQSANVVLKVYDALSTAYKAKFLDSGLNAMIKVSWQIMGNR